MPPGLRTIDYVFTLVSPWAYIGHARFVAICRHRGVAIRYRPVALSTVFPESGGLPLARRHPVRRKYRLVELQRWREARGMSFELHPPFWPFDTALADRTVLALLRTGADPESVIPAAFAAVWEEGRDLADPAELARLLRDAGHEAEAVLAVARSDDAAAAYAGATRAALAAGVFGTPSYILDGEIFWGQDRLDLLDAALDSGRAPYGA